MPLDYVEPRIDRATRAWQRPKVGRESPVHGLSLGGRCTVRARIKKGRLRPALVLVVLAASLSSCLLAGAGDVQKLSAKTYRVRYIPGLRICLDGRADDPAWSRAKVEKDFTFPWKQAPAPPTEFRALCDDRCLYFTFRVHDEDIFVLDKLRDEEDEVFEDRMEMYFSVDDRMKDYYCIEIDSRGRVFDYHGSHYRQLDPKWHCDGIEAKSSSLENGYVLEGRIPLASFEAMGFPRLRPGVKIRCGLYRAEFSHDRSGRPVVQHETLHNRGRRLDGPLPLEEWISWVDPKTKEPDFHIPSSLGYLEIVP